MEQRLSDHFTYTKLIRYALPSVIMTIFISRYGIMDGCYCCGSTGFFGGYPVLCTKEKRITLCMISQ